MFYIEGEDLRQRMERLNTIPEEDAILIGAAVCDALGYLHTRKPPVLHRDLKPGNIKITSDGQVFLVDFGLAKLVQGSQATTTGARAMTPGYSPPEQYGTARTDPRSDIYSLGATLYAALTGVIPEDGLARVMDNVELTPIRKHNTKVSRRLAAAIEKAMEAYPDDRYQTADEFRRSLLNSSSKTQRFTELDLNISVPPPPEGTQSESTAQGGKSQISPSTPVNVVLNAVTSATVRLRRRVRRFATQGAWIGFAFLLAAGWFSWVNNPAFRSSLIGMLPPDMAATYMPSPVIPTGTFTPPPPTATTVVGETRTPIPSVIPTETTLPPTPTALGGGFGQLAFVSTKTGIPQVYIMNSDGGNVLQVTKEQDGACQPDWSPDGKKIVYISPCHQKTDLYNDSSLYIMDVETGKRTALPASLGGDFEPAWCPDGKRIAFTSQRDGYPEIYMIILENNQIVRLTRAQSISGAIYARMPAWNPYGSQIAYVLKRTGLSQIWVTTDGDANMDKPNDRLVASPNNDTLPAWTPDGQFVVFSETSADGTAPYSLWSMRYEDRASRTAVRVPIEPLPVVDVSFSPDGYWMAFESWPDATVNQDIYMTTATGANRTRLTTDPGYDFDPVWRPNSQK